MMKQSTSIRLRATNIDDVEKIFEWENDPEHWFVSNTSVPFSREQIAQFIQFENDIYASNQTRFMIERDGETCGCVDLFDFDPKNKRVGVGILVDRAFRGQGIGTAAIIEIIEYCKELGVHQLFAEVAESNKASQFIFTSSRFQLTGRKEQWLWTGEAYVDQLFYQLILE